MELKLNRINIEECLEQVQGLGKVNSENLF